MNAKELVTQYQEWQRQLDLYVAASVKMERLESAIFAMYEDDKVSLNGLQIALSDEVIYRMKEAKRIAKVESNDNGGMA